MKRTLLDKIRTFRSFEVIVMCILLLHVVVVKDVHHHNHEEVCVENAKHHHQHGMGDQLLSDAHSHNCFICNFTFAPAEEPLPQIQIAYEGVAQVLPTFHLTKEGMADTQDLSARAPPVYLFSI